MVAGTNLYNLIKVVLAAGNAATHSTNTTAGMDVTAAGPNSSVRW